MKFIIYYGSTKKQNMKKVLDSLTESLTRKGHSYHIIDDQFLFCKNCGACLSNRDHCVLNDGFPNDLIKESDGIIVLSPIFFFSFSAKAKSFIDRLYSVELEEKILTAVTLSGSDPSSPYCGFDIIEEVLIRTSEYCGCKYVQPVNFVTNDVKLECIDHDLIRSFVDSLEV